MSGFIEHFFSMSKTAQTQTNALCKESAVCQLKSFGLLCKIDCSGEVKATCVNRELAVYLDILSQCCPFGVFVSTLGELIGRLCLLKPSGSIREDAVVKATVGYGNSAQSVLKVLQGLHSKHSSYQTLNILIYNNTLKLQSFETAVRTCDFHFVTVILSIAAKVFTVLETEYMITKDIWNMFSMVLSGP